MPDDRSGARRIGHRRLYDGRVLSLDVDDVVEPGEVRATREVVRHLGSVAVVAVDEGGRIVLVRQYRYAVDDRLWELPAGRLDAGETPEEGGRRELEEEVGRRAERFEPLCRFYTTPGFCDEAMHLFRATRLQVVLARPDEDERLEVAWFELAEALAMIDRGEVREAKTIIGLLLEARRTPGDSTPSLA